MSIFTKSWAYITAHVVPTKSASSSDAKTVASLRFMAITLLIIGLATSWLGIAPFAFTMLIRVLPDGSGWQFLAYCICIAICGLISMLVDFPLGVFVPNIFAKIFESKKTGLVWAKIISLLSLAGMLSYLTMTLSSSGGEMTTKQLFENDRPKSQSIGTIAMNDSLQEKGKEIKKEHASDIAKATAKDAAIKAEAAKVTKSAPYNAAKKFPLFKSNEYHRKEYNKVIEKARVDSMNLAFTARNLEGEQAALDRDLNSTNNAFLEEIEGKKTELAAEWKEYEHKTRVANLFLSYLGWVATPLFWLICLLTVLMGLDEKGKGGATITISNVRSFQDATKHITQQLARLKEAIENASTTSTYAANILAIYDEVETTYPAEFKAMQIRHSNLYSIFKRTDVEMYI